MTDEKQTRLHVDAEMMRRVSARARPNLVAEWSDAFDQYLKARSTLIRVWREEGRTWEQIALDLSCTESQAQRIFLANK